MGRDMLTNSRTHSSIGITKYKKREPRVKVRTDITKTLPPGFTLGDSHLFKVTTGSFGLTVGSMKIEKIDKPGTKLNTDEQDGGLCTNESYCFKGGRTGVDFELGVNTGFNTIVTEFITFRSNNKIVLDMVYASFISPGLLQAKAGYLSRSELLKDKRAPGRKINRREFCSGCGLVKSADIGRSK